MIHWNVALKRSRHHSEVAHEDLHNVIMLLLEPDFPMTKPIYRGEEDKGEYMQIHFCRRVLLCDSRNDHELIFHSVTELFSSIVMSNGHFLKS